MPAPTPSLLHAFLCRMRGHAPVAQMVWNEGCHFSRCRRCRREILRRHAAWTQIPRGFRVVWKPRPPGHPDWEKVMQRLAIRNFALTQEQRRKAEALAPPAEARPRAD